MKNEHEIRDPLYAFIKMTSAERNIIDSIPFQRLPGAVRRRPRAGHPGPGGRRHLLRHFRADRKSNV